MARKRKKETRTRRLFRDPSGQGDLFEKSLEKELEAKANTPGRMPRRDLIRSRNQQPV